MLVPDRVLAVPIRVSHDYGVRIPPCHMPCLPSEVQAYRRTSTFDELTLPDGLRRAHRTKQGVWGRIVVLEGKLRYTLDGEPGHSWVLSPQVEGVIAPAAPHHVEPLGPVRFYVEFLRLD